MARRENTRKSQRPAFNELVDKTNMNLGWNPTRAKKTECEQTLKKCTKVQ